MKTILDGPNERHYRFRGDMVHGECRDYLIEEQCLGAGISSQNPIFIRKLTIGQNAWSCDPETRLSKKDSLSIDADKLRRFIAELQDIAEFMEDHGMLKPEDEEGEDNDDGQ